MFKLLIALTTAVTLSATPAKVKEDDPIHFTVTVTGPYEGEVCLVALAADSDEAQGGICPQAWGDVELKEGESVKLEKDIEGPGKGEFRIEAVLPDADFYSNAVPVTIE